MTPNDLFGNRMKEYERSFTSQKITIDEIMCVRIDGRSFSKYTKNFKKPFDKKLTHTMIETTKSLVKETHADIGYVQSDEITLIYTKGDKATEHIFSGKISKINSVFASMATAYFNKYIHLVEESPNLAFFDCRAWGVPTISEASNVLLWRAQDARKNSISAFFRWTLGHKMMKNLSGIQMKEVLLQHGYDWEKLTNTQKYGTFIKTFQNENERSIVNELDIGYYGDLAWEDRVDFIKENSNDK